MSTNRKGGKHTGFSDAMKSLRISQPYSLATRELGFRPPQTEPPRKEVPRIEGAPAEIPQNEGARIEGSQLVAASSVGTQKPAPQRERPQKEAARVKVPQKKVPGTEVAQIEAPQNGYFRLAHGIFADPVVRNLTGDCFRLFLWLSCRAWRYPNSKGVIRAAISVMESHTGLSHASVSRSLKSLKEVGLVRLMETDFKRGNVWEVSRSACGDFIPDGPPLWEGPQDEAPSEEHAAATKVGTSSLKSSEEPALFEGDLNKENKSKKLSQEVPEMFSRFISESQSKTKRVREQAALIELLEQFTEEEIAMAAEYIRANGTLGGHQRCHSIFSYLSVAIDSVLALVRTPDFGAIQPIANNEQVKAGDGQPEGRIALAAFESTLSQEQQQNFMASFREVQFPHGFFPPAPIVRSMAASAWLSQRAA